MTEPDRPWTRRSFSPLFLRGRDWLASEYRQAGLAVSIDAGGNLIGRTEGKTNGISPIVIGSHSDTVPDGGRFDGILGLAAGIEVAQTLSEKGIVLGHPLEVIDFLAEEPSEFGISCVGSRAIAGLLDDTMLNAKAPNGETLKEGIARMGGAPERLSSRLRALGDTAAYVELHIEQGSVLESLGIPISVVTDIFGISRTKIVVEGQPDHAGTTPMDSRRDALVGAARIIETAYRKASDMANARQHVVATVGRLSVTPNAINAVPGRAIRQRARRRNEAVLRGVARHATCLRAGADKPRPDGDCMGWFLLQTKGPKNVDIDAERLARIHDAFADAGIPQSSMIEAIKGIVFTHEWSRPPQADDDNIFYDIALY